MTIQQIIKIYRGRLAAIYDNGECESITWQMLEHVLGTPLHQLVLKRDEAISIENEKKLSDNLSRLQKGEPLQYIIESVLFYGLKLKVNKHVLIPRPETEELVEFVTGFVNNLKLKTPNLKLLDIGTGSGCIAIALKKNLPETTVFAMDISEDALQVARENARLNNSKINFIKADILHPNSHSSQFPYDIIVSNPPYITNSEKGKMHKNVLQYEPHTALFVPDNDPLIFYTAIIEFSKKQLAEKGIMFVEINQTKADELKSLFVSNKFKCEIKKDLSGNDRFLIAKK